MPTRSQSGKSKAEPAPATVSKSRRLDQSGGPSAHDVGPMAESAPMEVDTDVAPLSDEDKALWHAVITGAVTAKQRPLVDKLLVRLSPSSATLQPTLSAPPPPRS